MIASIFGAISAMVIAFAYAFFQKEKKIEELKQKNVELEVHSKLIEVTNEAHQLSDADLGNRIRSAIKEHSRDTTKP